MKMMRRTATAIMAVLGVCMWTATPVKAGSAHLVLHSEAGDFIGQGKDWDITYTPANSTWFSAQIRRSLPGGKPAELLFILGTVTSGTDNTFSELFFGTDQLGIPIQPGTYLDAQRADFATAGHPGLDVSFQNRGSNTLTGSFTITDVAFFKDSLGQLQVARFAATFEQHSEGATPALFGSFTYQGAVVPEPVSIVMLGTAMVGLFGYGWSQSGRRMLRTEPAVPHST